MSVAIPPLPNTPSYRGAQLKHRDKFNFTFTFIGSSVISTSARWLMYEMCKVLCRGLLKRPFKSLNSDVGKPNLSVPLPLYARLSRERSCFERFPRNSCNCVLVFAFSYALIGTAFLCYERLRDKTWDSFCTALDVLPL